MKTSSIQRNHSIDTLRTVACLLVIILHISAQYLTTRFIAEMSEYQLFFTKLVQAFSRICVPLFILISGRFLLGKQESFKVFVERKAQRVLIPIAFWTAIYLAYEAYFYGVGVQTIKVFALKIVNGKPFYHMWYMYMLIGLYLITPFINAIISNIKRSMLWFIAVIVLLFGMSFYYLIMFSQLTLPFIFWFIYYLGYYLLGFLLKDAKKTPWILLLLFMVIALASIIPLNVWSETYFGKPVFHSYLSPLVIIGAVSFYKLLSQANIKENWLSKLAPLTFGVYLIHAGLLDLLKKAIVAYDIELFINPFLGIPLKLLLIFSISVFGIFLLSKSNWLQKMV